MQVTQINPVSVIVCTYNRAEQLSKIVGLLQNQDYDKDKYEIIIVDNGSTDNTKNISEELARQPGVRVRYVLESRRGVTFARNRGSEEALFPYLAYVDDDCTVGRDWLRSLMSGYDLDKDVFFVFGQVKNDWGGQIKPRWMLADMEEVLGDNSHLGDLPKILESRNGTREANLSIKKEILHSCGGFFGMEQFGSRNMASGELKYCLFQARKKGAKIAYVPTAIAYHHTVFKSRYWMIQRGYWQGITDGLFDYLLRKRKFWNSLFCIYVNLAAMLALGGQALFFMIFLDQSKGTYYLLRAARRFSLALCGLQLVGNWPRIYDWIRNHPS